MAVEINAAITAWERVDLSAERHVNLDQQGLAIADNQEKSAEGREALKEVIRAFKAVPAEERPAKIGGVIRAFQAEVDALTHRQSSAEAAFLSLYRSLDDAPDPLPALRGAAAELKRHATLSAEADGLRQRLSDYDREFASLKNQEARRPTDRLAFSQHLAILSSCPPCPFLPSYHWRRRPPSDGSSSSSARPTPRRRPRCTTRRQRRIPSTPTRDRAECSRPTARPSPRGLRSDPDGQTRGAIRGRSRRRTRAGG